jgi:hypothetical protein
MSAQPATRDGVPEYDASAQRVSDGWLVSVRCRRPLRVWVRSLDNCDEAVAKALVKRGYPPRPVTIHWYH